jgi:hypothetical protein
LAGPEGEDYSGQGCEEDVEMQELVVVGRGQRDTWRRKIEEANIQVWLWLHRRRRRKNSCDGYLLDFTGFLELRNYDLAYTASLHVCRYAFDVIH